MYKYIINFSYDGSNYKGYGTQLHRHTIQDKLEEVLSLLNSGVLVNTFASSRTDTKVHAKDQYLQVNLKNKYECQDLKYKINRLLPGDIYIKNIYEDFEDKINVRYDVLDKTYKYIIALEYSPFLQNYAYFEKDTLNIDKMNKCCKKFIGENDFSAFSNSKTGAKSKVRVVNFLRIRSVDFCNVKALEIEINANGFLYNMVRIIVGSLIQVGKNKLEIEELEKIKASKKRTENCPCAPAQGLYLEKIKFKGMI